MLHHLGADEQRHRAQRHGVEWCYCIFASSLYSGDGAIGSVFSRSDQYKSAFLLPEESFALLVRFLGNYDFPILQWGKNKIPPRQTINDITPQNANCFNDLFLTHQLAPCDYSINSGFCFSCTGMAKNELATFWNTMTYLDRPSRPYFHGQNRMTMKIQKTINSMHYKKSLNIKKSFTFFLWCNPLFHSARRTQPISEFN